MDPYQNAKDVHRCNLRKTAIVHCYCDLCHVNLCIPRIGKHTSDKYDRHKIAPFKEGRSTLIFSKCETHQHKTCKFLCKDCNKIFVCSSCIVSEQHERHKFVDVVKV